MVNGLIKLLRLLIELMIVIDMVVVECVRNSVGSV